MSPSPNAEELQAPAPAHRLRIILDVAEVQTGRSVTFSEVSEYLAGRGVSISRARWSYMVNGHRTVDDQRLLDALSDFVGVDRAYLRGDNGVPETVASQLDLVRALRATKVRS